MNTSIAAAYWDFDSRAWAWRASRIVRRLGQFGVVMVAGLVILSGCSAFKNLTSSFSSSPGVSPAHLESIISELQSSIPPPENWNSSTLPGQLGTSKSNRLWEDIFNTSLKAKDSR